MAAAKVVQLLGLFIAIQDPNMPSKPTNGCLVYFTSEPPKVLSNGDRVTNLIISPSTTDQNQPNSIQTPAFTIGDTGYSFNISIITSDPDQANSTTAAESSVNPSSSPLTLSSPKTVSSSPSSKPSEREVESDFEIVDVRRRGAASSLHHVPPSTILKLTSGESSSISNPLSSEEFDEMDLLSGREHFSRLIYQGEVVTQPPPSLNGDGTTTETPSTTPSSESTTSSDATTTASPSTTPSTDGTTTQTSETLSPDVMTTTNLTRMPTTTPTSANDTTTEGAGNTTTAGREGRLLVQEDEQMKESKPQELQQNKTEQQKNATTAEQEPIMINQIRGETKGGKKPSQAVKGQPQQQQKEKQPQEQQKQQPQQQQPDDNRVQIDSKEEDLDFVPVRPVYSGGVKGGSSGTKGGSGSAVKGRGGSRDRPSTRLREFNRQNRIPQFSPRSFAASRAANGERRRKKVRNGSRNRNGGLRKRESNGRRRNGSRRSRNSNRNSRRSRNDRRLLSSQSRRSFRVAEPLPSRLDPGYADVPVVRRGNSRRYANYPSSSASSFTSSVTYYHRA